MVQTDLQDTLVLALRLYKNAEYLRAQQVIMDAKRWCGPEDKDAVCELEKLIYLRGIPKYIQKQINRIEAGREDLAQQLLHLRGWVRNFGNLEETFKNYAPHITNEIFLAANNCATNKTSAIKHLENASGKYFEWLFAYVSQLK